jgi:hypothetical protein
MRGEWVYIAGVKLEVQDESSRVVRRHIVVQYVKV